MVAADTNVVIRLLTHDDAPQAARAVALFRSEDVWLSKSVLLETEWVLRGLYGFPGDRTAGALRRLTGLPNVHVEDSDSVSRALDWASSGLEFADALHLASRGADNEFVSFDRKLMQRAKRAGVSRNMVHLTH